MNAVEDSVSPIHDHRGRLTGAVLVFRDVSDARAVRERLVYSAGHDSLTGLPNRGLFNDRLTQGLALAWRNDQRMAVLYLDLDGFKPVNDYFGHEIGDRLLKSVSARLRRCVRSSDTVGRQGGDEFLILLSDLAHARDAEVISSKILCALAAPHRVGAQVLTVGASIGIANYPDDGADAESLVSHADAVMYQAKFSGGNGYRFFDAVVHSPIGRIKLPRILGPGNGSAGLRVVRGNLPR